MADEAKRSGQLATRCPACETVFRITAQQLRAHRGEVRCGRCETVFDAFLGLAPLPEARIPEPTPAVPAPVEPPPWPPAAAAPTPPAFRDGAAGTPIATGPLPLPEPSAEIIGWQASPEEKTARWGWGVGSGVLLLLLAAQSAYLYRDELAARYPAAKPYLAQACAQLGCGIPLPRRPEALAIEGSDLQVPDPAQPQRLVLNAAFRNRAPVAVESPAIELTLTDPQEKTVARKVFRPADYLPKGAAELSQGIPPGNEISVSLRLDTQGLNAAGYRLFLFYP